MELVAIIATIILVATLLTLVFSFAAYFVTRAKKLLPKRQAKRTETDEEPASRIYFKRYLPKGDSGDTAAGKKTAKAAEQWM